MRMRQVGERREALICWFAFPLFPARSLARFPLPARPLDRPYAARRDGCRIVKKKIKFWEGRRSVSLLRVEEMTRREEVMRRVRWGGGDSPCSSSYSSTSRTSAEVLSKTSKREAGGGKREVIERRAAIKARPLSCRVLSKWLAASV